MQCFVGQQIDQPLKVFRLQAYSHLRALAESAKKKPYDSTLLESYRVVAGKLVQRPVQANFFFRRSLLKSLDAGVSRRAIGTNVQAATAVIDTVGTGAGGNGTLQSVLVSPALDVVTVETVTGTIATCPNKAVEVLDGSSVVEKLIEDRKDGLGVRFGANTEVVVTNCGESNLSWRVSETTSLGRLTSCLLTWLLWSAVSKFFPSQQDGKKVSARSLVQGLLVISGVSPLPGPSRQT